jgi:hypothetical protein
LFVVATQKVGNGPDKGGKSGLVHLCMVSLLFVEIVPGLASGPVFQLVVAAAQVCWLRM